MEVVLAVEVMSGVLHSLHLNSSVIKFVLALAQVCHEVQGLQGLLCCDVACQCEFPGADRPNVEIVYFLNAWQVLYIVFKLININVSWSSFHENHYAITEDRNGSHHNDN